MLEKSPRFLAASLSSALLLPADIQFLRDDPNFLRNHSAEACRLLAFKAIARILAQITHVKAFVSLSRASMQSAAMMRTSGSIRSLLVVSSRPAGMKRHALNKGSEMVLRSFTRACRRWGARGKQRTKAPLQVLQPAKCSHQLIAGHHLVAHAVPPPWLSCGRVSLEIQLRC